MATLPTPENNWGADKWHCARLDSRGLNRPDDGYLDKAHDSPEHDWKTDH